MSKRIFDVVLAALGLCVLMPLLAVIAVLIKRDSPGPVFFRQERVGRYGRLFRIHKFRTMVADAPLRGPPITVGDDPRITGVGAWLRRSRLDELPQLLDVLKGDMSLVGPRPEVPKYVELYPSELREAVLSLRPGITDPSSLEFLDEAQLLAGARDPEREYREVILPAKLRASALYARRATLGTDLLLLLRTVLRLAGRRR